MRTTLRSKLTLLIMAFSLVLALPAIALADIVTNNVVQSSASQAAITEGGSTTVSYWIAVQGTGQDGQGGCNASDGGPATVTINTPTGVSADKASLSFTECGEGKAQTVTFSSSTPGVYSITHGVSDATTPVDGGYTNSANFTLNVQDNCPSGDQSGSRTDGTCAAPVTNRAPVAANDTLTTNEDAAGTANNVLANDSDADGDTLSVTGKTNGTNGTVSCTAAGACTYTPAENFNGSDSFIYTVSDGKATATGTVNVTVNAVNDAPSFTKGADQTVPEDFGAQTVPGWATNISAGPGNESTQSVNFEVTNNTNTALFSTQPSVAPNGTLTYTPAANAHGTATVSIKAHDDGGIANGSVNESAVQTFTITVNAVNDAPVAVDDAKTTAEDTSVVIDVVGNDTDVDGDTLSVAANTLSTPANGTAVLISSGADAGKIRYTPAQDFYGADSFTYKVSDGTTNSNTAATVSISVTPVDDAPVAVNDTKTVLEDATATTIDVLNNDTDIDGGPKTIASVTQPSNGTVTITNNGDDLTYRPNANYCKGGSPTDDFKYKLNGGSEATVAVTVTCVNDEPTAVDDTATTDEDTPVTILASALLNNDSAGPANESGQTLSIKEVTNSQNGQAVLNPDGSVTFTPDQDFYGQASFDYTVCDNGGTANGGVACYTGTAIVRVTVSPVNDAPIAVNDAGNTTLEDTSTDIDVIANDTDVDNTELRVSSFDATSAQGGTVSKNADGTLKYQPAANFNGSDSFKYKVSDGSLNSTNEATVSISVAAVNDAPSFQLPASPNQTVLQNAGAQSVANFATSISAGPANESGQTVSFLASNDKNSLFSVQPAISANGTLTYTPAPGAIGTAKVTVKAQDNGGTANGGVDASAEKTFNISVNYKFDGFRQPVDMKDMNGNWIFNSVKAGQSIPMKFSLFGNQGLGILQPSTQAAPNPKVTAVTCPNSGTLVDQIEQTTTANNGLTYDATIDQYNYVWKTQSTYAGKCYQFDMVLIDGTSHVAYFKFTK